MESKGANCFFAVLLLSIATTAFSSPNYHTGLMPYYYDNACPQALPAIRRVVKEAVKKERRMGASLLRLHFHDCFVNGCDASVLLDPSPTIDSEKLAGANNNSIRGFEVIDQIKEEVDKVCGRGVVSCADILAVAARDSVVALGGPWWNVRLGRRDSTTASRTTANTDLPAPFMDLSALTISFQKQGLDTKDLVVLSGGHTLGFAQCFTFKERAHKDSNIHPKFAKKLQSVCARAKSESDSNIVKLDPTSTRFDTFYYKNLLKQKGLLKSDQALFGGGNTDELVRTYSDDAKAFWKDFAKSMVKMGNIKPLTGNLGQVRHNCRWVN